MSNTKNKQSFSHKELTILLEHYQKNLKILCNDIKLKDFPKTLTRSEIEIYELLSGEDIVHKKIPDHKHNHCYYVIDREGHGRWRKYEHIVKFLLLRVEKLVKKTKETPHRFPHTIKKKKTLTLSLDEEAMLHIYQVAYEKGISLSEAASELIDSGYSKEIRKQMCLWKARLEKNKA